MGFSSHFGPGVAAHVADALKSPVSKTPIWLGEGGVSYRYGGVVDVWLKVYGGSLSYLEDLGCAASNGATVFARQQLSNFIGPASNATGVPASYKPLPSWWVAILWKRLMGTTVHPAVINSIEVYPALRHS